MTSKVTFIKVFVLLLKAFFVETKQFCDLFTEKGGKIDYIFHNTTHNHLSINSWFWPLEVSNGIAKVDNPSEGRQSNWFNNEHSFAITPTTCDSL